MEIYRHLPYLLEMWLVRESRLWKRKLYQSVSPSIIEELFQKMKHESQSAIEEMKEKFSYLENRPSVTYQEWANSITYVFQDLVHILRKWDVFYRISSEKDVTKSNSYLPKDYRKIRDAKELERYAIMSQKTAANKKPRAEREIAIIPENYEQFDENIQMIIYENKIAYIDYNSESSIIIESKKIADFQKKLFMWLFKSLKHKKT